MREKCFTWNWVDLERHMSETWLAVEVRREREETKELDTGKVKLSDALSPGAFEALRDSVDRVRRREEAYGLQFPPVGIDTYGTLVFHGQGDSSFPMIFPVPWEEAPRGFSGPIVCMGGGLSRRGVRST